MTVQIEDLLRDSSLRYTKEVDADGDESYSLPFETSQELIVIHVQDYSGTFHVGTLLRRLDALPLRGTTKALLNALLKLNAYPSAARVFLWTSSEDESDWIGVDGGVPSESLTSDSAVRVINDVVEMGDKILATIQSQVADVPQKQLP